MLITIGVDVGQRTDPTAVCVSELIWKPTGKEGSWEDHHYVRMVRRLKLGTPYPEVVQYVEGLLNRVEGTVRAGTLERVQGALEPTDAPAVKLMIDATGVGQPVVDMFSPLERRIVPVYFNHGDRLLEDIDEITKRRILKMGKAYMVSRLQVLLQNRRLRFPTKLYTVELEQLQKELINYEIRITEKANDTYGAFKVGTHDDIVTAVGLSVIEPPKIIPVASSTVSVTHLPEWAGGYSDDTQRGPVSDPSWTGLSGFGNRGAGGREGFPFGS